MRFIFLVITVCSFLKVKSQDFFSWKYNDRYYSVFAGTGTASYFGELNYNNSLNDNLSLINIGAEVRLLKRISARLEIEYFAMNGSDINAPDSSFQRQRNLSFHSHNFQIQLSGTYYFRPYREDYLRRWAFDPYAFTGIGYLHYSPKARLDGKTYNLRPLKTEGETYREWTFAIPIGVGTKFRVSDFVNVIVEVSYHYVFTDYLDDVSKNYGLEFNDPTAELLSNRKDEIPLVNQDAYDRMIPGAPRGNDSSTDGLLMIRLKGEFYLPHYIFSKKKK